jgi:hypothetical protein
VRKLILNMKTGGELEEVELERSTSSDTVILRNGDSVFGEITNEKFGIETFYGKLDLPAKQVVGFVSVPGQEDLVRAVLVGGQVLTGKLKDENVDFSLPTGGKLTVPFSRIKECSYAVTKARPAESPLTDPLIMLRTGDRLAFDPGLLKCSFQTRHGKIDLDGKDLLEVRLDQEDHGIHRAEFLNGSRLSGLLEPEKVVLPLKLGPKLDIPRDMIQALRFMAEAKESDDLARVRLDNEDELLGKLADEQYVISTDYGTVNVKPANISAMSFDRNDPSKVAITMWDNSVLRGKLQQDSVKFALTPGPVVTLHIDLIAMLSCPQSLPPEDVIKKVQKLVAMLSAAAYKDRQEAQEELTRLGPKVIPLLKKSLADGDPEVRQRLTVILETLGQKVEEPKADGNPPMPMGFIRGG